ncbi:hypothetical protein J2T09_005409 [Neorhizobium huautlense]|uniref:Uncharacterized protein n=1 Tax=Neorhizobium huautlense TaxID=67774 RepID=A0ABT9Q2M4_9HYPH|nr:hypothetical protein [Neorhizobium huautlense]MDP9840621.1 hypothetical protein [Neorhizobium huautlense]
MELSGDALREIVKTAADGAGTDAAYQYRFDPDTLFTGVMAAPILTVTNPSQTDGSGTRTIYVLMPIGPDPDDITTAAGGLAIVASDPRWLVSPYLTADPPYLALSGPALKGLASISFEFQNLLVSSSRGTASFLIRELVGSGSATKTIVKDAASLAIESFYASPVTVTKGAQTTLTWVVSGGSYVVLQPGSIRRNIIGSGVFTDSVKMDVDVPSQSYLLQLYTDDRQFVQQVTVAFVGSVLAQLNSNVTGRIGTKDEAALTWSAQYTDTDPSLITPIDTTIVDKSGTKTIVPGNYLTGNSSSVAVSLTADGFNGPRTSTVTFDFENVGIRWFRYTDMSKTTTTYDVVNAAPGSPRVSGTIGNWTLTTYGPGAGQEPLRAYLGGPQLQVQVLTATPNPAKPGDVVTVTYATGNALSAALGVGIDQPTSPVPLDTDSQTGSTTIQAPAASTTLVLIVRGRAASDVSSQLDLTVNQAVS